MKVTLNKPIQRGDETISEVELMEPSAGQMRGLSIVNLMQMDVATVMKLLPRITNPALLPAEIDALRPADLLELAGSAVSFFGSEADRAEMASHLKKT